MTAADKALTPLLVLATPIIPTIEAIPTIKVIAISAGENVPVTMRAQPRRNSQMALISSSQNTKHGRTAHFVSGERRNPSTMPIQSGEVCTMCRITPRDTAPTTSKAVMMATPQIIKIRESLSIPYLAKDLR